METDLPPKAQFLHRLGVEGDLYIDDDPDEPTFRVFVRCRLCGTILARREFDCRSPIDEQIAWGIIDGFAHLQHEHVCPGGGGVFR